MYIKKNKKMIYYVLYREWWWWEAINANASNYRVRAQRLSESL